MQKNQIAMQEELSKPKKTQFTSHKKIAKLKLQNIIEV
jgi:hypothetical protein